MSRVEDCSLWFSALPSELLVFPSRLFSPHLCGSFLRTEDLEIIPHVSQLCPLGSQDSLALNIGCVHVHDCAHATVFIAGQRTHWGLSSLHPPHRFWRLYSNYQTWQQPPLPLSHLVIPAFRALHFTLGHSLSALHFP